MIYVANANGLDVFEGRTIDQSINRFKNASQSDVDKITYLFQKQESNWSSSDKVDAIASWQRATGEKIDS